MYQRNLYKQMVGNYIYTNKNGGGKMKKKNRPPFWFEETFDRIRRMEEDLHRLMQDIWKSAFNTFTGFEFPRLEKEINFGNIPTDLAETKDEIIIRADLPGFSKEEIKVKATEDSVIIEAEKKEERKESAENYVMQERRYGAVRRVIPLPVQVIPEEAKAKFKDGVLEIRLKKAYAEEEKEKEIEIE